MMDKDYQQQIVAPKMSGYLEKKERKTMISSYKKYWFVLDGTLLVYYRSKDEYSAISPCKGTITLGPTCHVKPCTSNNGVFQIESKTTTITLRAETKEEQHKWMQAIILALNQKMEYKKLNHFRHSVGEVPKTCENADDVSCCKKPLSAQTSIHSRASQQSLIERLQKMGAKSYGGIFSKNLQAGLNLPQLQAQKLKSFSTESLPLLAKHGMSSQELKNLDNSKKNITANSVNSIYDTLDHVKDDVFFENKPDLDEELYETLDCKEESNGENHRTSMMTSNDIYWDSKELECDDLDIHPDVNHNLLIKEDDEGYTDIEQVRETLAGKPQLLEINSNLDYMVIEEALNKTRNSSGSSQESCANEKKKRFGFGKKSKKSSPEEKDRKVRKSESFLQRVLNKKSKSKKQNSSTERVDKLKETIEGEEETAQKLSELQYMLREKVKLHMRQRKQSVEREEEMENSRESVKFVCNDLYDVTGLSVETGDQQSACPSLPPRNHSQVTSSVSSIEPITSPINLEPSVPTAVNPPNKQPPKVPPKRRRKYERNDISQLDEILTDLNRDEGGKVKQLIKRYSNIPESEEVEIRKKKISTSNDLDKLLDELAKVTVAPIMTPGVTTSLINPDVADQEMLKMAEPRRKRRNSDPDYDVPRPHRSLVILSQKDNNALEATTFFGPILQPSDLPPNYDARPTTPPVDYSNLPSITPDSLEVESTKTHDEIHRLSYESHDYKRFNKSSHYNLDALENAYADPNKLLMLKGYFPTYDSPMSSFHLESRFIDSLEP
ncbi:uncharacterized protein LOC126747089 isoform X2 [Anthonomus grandis grandis]|uniref:uncharacterized protein LOC126747089 isoform X2 n=1 Tax=Anthonomus grandis grandis TaxID=2921223 RepID=UPI002166A349|nr:uncharacterized protein LOC126747089 isoform X2 [Anthonomus grandis grandis]